jgi:hypothetical protein
VEVDFLFLDESISRDTAWLTGVFVGAGQYPDVRDAMIRIARAVLMAMGRSAAAPIELHGVAMLSEFPEATDEHRLRVFSEVVSLVNRAQLEVLSVGHVDKDNVRRNYSDIDRDPGDKLYGQNLFELVEALQLHEDALLIPVFDGVPGRALNGKKQSPVDRFAHAAFLLGGNVTQWNRIVFEDKPNPIVHHKPNLRNFMEPLFADSAGSPLLQLADIVGYLLDATDREDLGTASEWKSRVASVARQIDPRLVNRRLLSIKFDGPQAPATSTAK